MLHLSRHTLTRRPPHPGSGLGPSQGLEGRGLCESPLLQGPMCPARCIVNCSEAARPGFKSCQGHWSAAMAPLLSGYCGRGSMKESKHVPAYSGHSMTVNTYGLPFFFIGPYHTPTLCALRAEAGVQKRVIPDFCWYLPGAMGEQERGHLHPQNCSLFIS